MGDAPVSARLLDLTRLTSRAGRVLTGIDRVELAYLKALSEQETPAFGLLRSPLGYLLLDEAGLRGLAEADRGGACPGERRRGWPGSLASSTRRSNAR